MKLARRLRQMDDNMYAITLRNDERAIPPRWTCEMRRHRDGTDYYASATSEFPKAAVSKAFKRLLRNMS